MENYADFNYSVSEFPCPKHPNSPPVGICAFCLKERLVKLVCSDCGEQRLSSCSCSDVSSSYRNSCSSTVGSVGRISFLLENEKIENPQFANRNPNPRIKNEQVIFLRRSSSSCVEVKKSNGFWKIKRLFRKKARSSSSKQNGVGVSADKSEIWVSDVMGVSRSRSLCSFRGGNDQEGFCSSAKISDVTGGIFFNDQTREHSHRNSIARRPSGFRVRESDFSGMDESAFIDLKLDPSLESKQQEGSGCGARISGAGCDHGVCSNRESFMSLASLRNNGDSSSCRISVNDNKGLRRSKSHKVWKWISKYHPVHKK